MLAGLVVVSGVLVLVVIWLPPNMLVCAEVVGVCAAPPKIELGLAAAVAPNEFVANRLLPAKKSFENRSSEAHFTQN